MKPSESLFDLIKSLTHEELELVRIQSAFHVKKGQNKYLLLLNEIEKQQEYNEHYLIELFDVGNDLNKFAFLKNYTYNFILDTLENASGYTLKKIRELLNYAEVLLNRKLPELALHYLNEAEKLAGTCQHFDSWFAALSLKLDFAEYLGTDQEMVRTEMEKVLHGRNSFIHYYRLFCLVRMKHHQNSFIRDFENVKEFKDVHEEELLESNPAYNFHHKLYFYLSKCIVYYAKKEFDRSYIIVNEILKMWDAYPQMIDVRFGAYYNTLYNKAEVEMEFNEFVKSIESINLLYSKLVELKRYNPFQHYMLYNLCITVYNKSGYFDRAFKIINDFLALRKKLHYATMSPYSEQSFNFYAAIVFFGVENYKQSNKHLNRIINNALEYNHDITSMAHLMSLIVHFELGNRELINYRIKSVHRFLTKRDSLQSIMNHLLDTLKKLVKSNSPTNEKALFLELKILMENDLLSDPIQKDLFEYFDILSWVDSKIEGKSFMHIVKTKKGFAFEGIPQI